MKNISAIQNQQKNDKTYAWSTAIGLQQVDGLTSSHLIAIHGRLFSGIYKFAGKLRDYDITKHEWVLDGDTVMYGVAFELKAALDYDFDQERNFSYKNLTTDEIVKHITFFVSRL